MPIQYEEPSSGFTTVGTGPARHDAELPADIAERQCCRQSLDPLLLKELFYEKGFDGRPCITTTSVDNGGDIGLNLIGVARGLRLIDHRHLP